MKIIRLWPIAAVMLACPGSAAETQTYVYDTHGRLVTVSRSGGPTNGVVTRYAHDTADNRTNLTVTGTGRAAPANSGAARAPSTNGAAAGADDMSEPPAGP